MTATQVTARLGSETKAFFETYANSIGLNASELAKLLIVREKYQRRLETLTQFSNCPEQSGRRPSGRRPTITAHLSSSKQVEEFDVYAKQCGLSRSRASAYLIEAEVREHWLERALSAPFGAFST